VARIWRSLPLLIAKVRYGTKNERAGWMKDAFNNCLIVLNNHDVTVQHIYSTAFIMFRMTLYHSMSSKHPGFAKEHEWRIVCFGDMYQDLLKDRRSYLIRGNTVEPKLKFPIAPLRVNAPQTWDFDSIVYRIVLGPTHASSLAFNSAKRMLECLGKPELASKLWVSDVPYQAGS
jgi:hypothetical protein